jgi:glucose/arabinose dehydrogenase
MNHPELHDVPGRDVVLTGQNFQTPDLFGMGSAAVTGSFKPYNVACEEDEKLKGNPRASGAVMRVAPDGGEFDLFAWGFRNPRGMGVHADGRIFCTDIGMEDRGSRPVVDGRSYMWQVIEGGWYGWPDYSGNIPVTDPDFQSENADQAQFLMKDQPPLAVSPVIALPKGTGIARFDFSRSLVFAGDAAAFVALMGDPSSKDQTLGSKVITVDTENGIVRNFMANHEPGPASLNHNGGLERPIDIKFDPTGEVMYVLDLGILDTTSGEPRTLPGTGVLWRVKTSDAELTGLTNRV